MAQNTQQRTINGVDVGRLKEVIEAVRNDPGLADFRFRLDNEWLGLGHNRSHIGAFHGVRQEHRMDRPPFVLDSDEPEVMLGRDEAP